MKFNSKNLLIFLAVIVFIILAFFAVYSKKSSVSSPNNNVPTSSSGVESESANSEVNVSEISLEITSPKDGEILTKSPVLLTGTTLKGADVFVNDAEAKADEDGNFEVSVPLEEGENEIFVVVNDSEGSYAEGSVKITLNTE